MFKRLRQLRISLAAKCQLLFGAAVVLIIAAALFVPWQRMEQLTVQLNERAAGALAEHAIAEHIATYAAPPGSVHPAARPTTAPATRPSAGEPAGPLGVAATTLPSDSEGTGSPSPPSAPRPRSSPSRRRSRGSSRWTCRGRLRNRTGSSTVRSPTSRAHPDSMTFSAYYERSDGTRGYRYAQPLLLDQTCLRCHVPASDAPSDARSDATLAASLTRDADPASSAGTRPTPSLAARTVPVKVDAGRRAGIVSVDIGSRIDANELLLNRVFILLAGLLAGGLAIVIFYLITTRLILQPVRVLQETAEKVSKGDLNIRSDISTGDEFQQLSETFNVMLANLSKNADQLRSINKGLDLKLGQLAETNVALYESNRLKSEFLANVSHELRTPLNSILGFAELLRDAVNAPPDAKSARYIGNILRSGRNLLDLINDLLDLAKIEAGRMEIRSEPLSVSDVFEGLTTILRPLAEQKRVQIVASVGPDVPILQSDPGKLQQVLYNFLSNAIKFSPEGEAVDLKASVEGDDPEVDGHPGHVRISVTDRGPGIEPDKHAMIFEKFRQIDGSVTRSHSGTGLGLAISKELTALLGGSIGVASAPAKARPSGSSSR